MDFSLIQPKSYIVVALFCACIHFYICGTRNITQEFIQVLPKDSFAFKEEANPKPFQQVGNT